MKEVIETIGYVRNLAEYVRDHVHAFIDSEEIEKLLSFDEWRALNAGAVVDGGGVPRLHEHGWLCGCGTFHHSLAYCSLCDSHWPAGVSVPDGEERQRGELPTPGLWIECDLCNERITPESDDLFCRGGGSYCSRQCADRAQPAIGLDHYERAWPMHKKLCPICEANPMRPTYCEVGAALKDGMRGCAFRIRKAKGEAGPGPRPVIRTNHGRPVA